MSEAAVHVDRWGSVYFKMDHTESQILDGLRMLRDPNRHAQIETSVQDIPWTEGICREMIMTFKYHNDLGHHWRLAKFYIALETTHMDLSLSVLQSPVTTEFFRKFDFVCCYDYQEEMTSQEATTIAVLLRRGCSVCISDEDGWGGYGIGQECMSILSQGLVTPASGERSSSSSGGPPDLTFSRVVFLHKEDSWETRSAVQCLADGLERNKTLNSFNCYMNMNDDAAAKIVRSLFGHPSLTRLDMCEVEFGELTTTAIRRLLATLSCKVVNYTFENEYLRYHPGTEAGPFFDLAPFLAQLQPIVRERLYLNRCIDLGLRGEEVPLSYWAVALARVNNPNPILPLADRASRQADVTYEMLHGPVCAGRGRFDG